MAETRRIMEPAGLPALIRKCPEGPAVRKWVYQCCGLQGLEALKKGRMEARPGKSSVEHLAQGASQSRRRWLPSPGGP